LGKYPGLFFVRFQLVVKWYERLEYNSWISRKISVSEGLEDLLEKIAGYRRPAAGMIN